MLLKNNPITNALHNDWRARIKQEFSNINFNEDSNYLSIISYIDCAPQKFYSKESFTKYFKFLEDVKTQEPDILANILKETESFLSLSNKTLSEINLKPIHDIILPTDHNELIKFIDEEVHYNLLKLYETPFYYFTYIISKYFRIKRSAGTDGLDLHHAIDELKNSDFKFIGDYYLHNVRNGIGHGKIIFTDQEIFYIDKKGNEERIQIKKIIDAFDKTLDITNGLCLAFKLFCFTNMEYFEEQNIPIPRSILIEELKTKANAPAWEITNCLDSVALNDKKQLIIYINNNNWDPSKVRWYCFTTAYLAESFTKAYDRIFLSLHSKHSESFSGWAAFDGVKLRDLRIKKETLIEEYKGVLEENLIFFSPKIKFPKLIYKLGSFRSALQSIFPLHWKAYKEKYFPNPFVVRDTRMHSRGGYLFIQDPSVIIKPNFQENIEHLIEANYKKIVRMAISYSRKQCSWYSLARYLPVGNIRVFVYDTDKRVRNLRYSGLPEVLVATIEINRTKIKGVDIIGSTIKQYGKYRIAWHNKWHKREEIT